MSYDIIYMWNLKKKKKIQMNPFTQQKETYRHRKETYAYQMGRKNKLGGWD